MPLHLSIRFDEGLFSGKIVYNSELFPSLCCLNVLLDFKNGNWSDDEQRISSPYKSEELFDLRVRILGGTYKVYGNRKEIGTFQQRVRNISRCSTASAALFELSNFVTIKTISFPGELGRS